LHQFCLAIGMQRGRELDHLLAAGIGRHAPDQTDVLPVMANTALREGPRHRAYLIGALDPARD
jgi:hypothetical protein